MAPKNERVFEPNASIVLVGCRGAGKRTLGFMGALHLRRRLVTEDHYFEKVTGFTRGQYLARHGREQFARQNIEVFKRMLSANRVGCVIECGMSSLSEEAQDALRQLTATNPVVYIHREKEQIVRLLDAADAQPLLEADAKHRSCSNFEYYNLYDSGTPISRLGGGTAGPDAGLTCRTGPSKLLGAQEDFTRFLDAIIGRGATKAWLQSPFSVAAIPPEFRAVSFALRLRLSYLMDMDLEWEDFEARADCIELIIDHWPQDMLEVISRQVALMRRKLRIPIIYHVEENPRGERRRSLEERNAMDAELLELGLRLGVEYVSVDLQRDPALTNLVLQHKGRSKVVGNYWYMGLGALPWQDEQQIENYRSAQSLGCEVVRMGRFCSNDSPVEYLESFRKTLHAAVPGPKPPLVAFDFSVLGIRTPIQSRVLGPVKHPDMENDRDHLATVSNASHSLELLFRQFLLDPLQYYVLGSHVSYSLSPAMHTAAYDFTGMPHTFQAVACSTLESINQICSSDTFGGACLTAPFKVAIIPHLKLKSHHATAIGAVNVLLPLRGTTPAILEHANARNRAGPAREFYGDNTDWSAIFTCLRRAISPRNYVQPSRTTALVVGAGGMARAAIYALYQLGCRNVFIYNRTVDRAREVAGHFNTWAAQSQGQSGGSSAAEGREHLAAKEMCRVISSLGDPWPAGFQLPTMVVSCVPATRGADGSPPADFLMPGGWLGSPTGGVVVELAYEPLITPLVAQMRQRTTTSSLPSPSPTTTTTPGTTSTPSTTTLSPNETAIAAAALPAPPWVVVDGLEVVAEMAIEAFELMTGRMAPKRLMKEVCRKTWEGQQQQQHEGEGQFEGGQGWGYV